MAVYFTEAELEARMGMLFSATTTPTGGDTVGEIFDMAQEISNLYDGLAQQAVGTETPDEYVTQACLSCAVYTVGQVLNGEPVDALVQIKIIKEFLKKTTTQLYYTQSYPQSSGKF